MKFLKVRVRQPFVTILLLILLLILPLFAIAQKNHQRANLAVKAAEPKSTLDFWEKIDKILNR